MKFNIFASLILSSLIFTACDDNTDEIGYSLIDNMDHLEITTDTFYVSTRSIIADSVLSRNTIGYLGKIHDPETGVYITSDFMTQFHTLENYEFPEKDSIKSLLDGQIIADSCEIRLFYSDFYGDSLSTMKLTAYEMNTPMSEAVKYYSNYDPMKDGLVRGDGIKINKIYSLTDLNVKDSIRNSSNYTPNIRIKLDKEYIDKEGNKYNNYGTYIMRKYYEDPSNFKDSYNFIHNVVPGFYFKTQGGLGSMAYINISQLNVYFRYFTKDSIYVGASSFAGTEEVLQSTKIQNDKKALERLVADNNCTYLKSPSGIFTEMTLPVEEIMRNHENDTINTAKVILPRINSKFNDEYSLKIPQTLLMIPIDEIYSFFENNKVADYKTSFIATYNSQYNNYTFNNIGSLIKSMDKKDKTNNKWNKVAIIPVTVTYSSTSTSNEITKVAHDMSMTSTKLVGGSNNPYKPLTISVVYSKFK